MSSKYSFADFMSVTYFIFQCLCLEDKRPA